LMSLVSCVTVCFRVPLHCYYMLPHDHIQFWIYSVTSFSRNSQPLDLLAISNNSLALVRKGGQGRCGRERENQCMERRSDVASPTVVHHFQLSLGPFVDTVFFFSLASSLIAVYLLTNSVSCG